MDIRVFFITLICFLRFKYSSGKLQHILQILDIMPENPMGTIIFLHCRGDSGPGFKSWMDYIIGGTELFTDMHLIFPTAPLTQYTPEGPEAVVPGWYDEDRATPKGAESLRFLNPVAEDLVEIIKNETKLGIQMSNIFIGGFQMGGTMAMHVAYRYIPTIGGCFPIASYLKDRSYVFRSVKARLKRDKNAKIPELFYLQGEQDPIVKPKWSERSFVKLRRVGVRGNYFSFPTAHHEVTLKELAEVDRWILTKMGGGFI